MGALAAVENRGRLEANGGVVYLHARLAAAVLDDAVNHSGTVDATGLGGAADGSVTLVGSGGVARSTGAIDSGTVSMTSASGLLIGGDIRSEEHTSELQSLMRISYAVFCLKKKKNTKIQTLQPKHLYH